MLIDPLKLADEGADLHGVLGMGGMPRLRELCANDSGEVSVDLHFERGAQGLRLMRGSLRAQLPVVCQCCMQPLVCAIGVETCLILLKPGEADAIPIDDADTLLVSKPLSLSEIVEDELLLAMPMIPRHVSGECRASVAEPVSETRETNPFAALHRLKRD